MNTARIIGPPRTGTNLVKFLVETNSDVRCYFNLGWWKHAIIPPSMSPGKAHQDFTPTIILFREPVRHLVSLFRFAQKGRTAIRGASTLDDFTKDPIFMEPPESVIEYSFSAPTEYLYQFYYSTLKWKNPNKLFLALEDVRKNPGIVLCAIRQLFPQAKISEETPRVPENYLGRNGDFHVSEVWSYDSQFTLADEDAAANELIKMFADPISNLLPAGLVSVYRELTERRFFKVDR